MLIILKLEVHSNPGEQIGNPLALRCASGMATPALASWRMELKVGDLIDAQFDDGKWFDAVVVDVKLVPYSLGKRS